MTMHDLLAAEGHCAHLAAQLFTLRDFPSRIAAQDAIPARESDRRWKLTRSHDIWRAAGVDGEEDENGAGVNGRAYTAQGDCPMVGGAAWNMY